MNIILGVEKIQKYGAKNCADIYTKQRQEVIQKIDREIVELEAKAKNISHDYLANDYSHDLYESGKNLRDYIIESRSGAVYTPYNTKFEDIRIKERIAYLKHMKSQV